MLLEQSQAVTDAVALVDVAAAGFFARQGALRHLDELLHQCLSPAHRIDDTGTENGSQRRRYPGHGGQGTVRVSDGGAA